MGVRSGLEAAFASYRRRVPDVAAGNAPCVAYVGRARLSSLVEGVPRHLGTSLPAISPPQYRGSGLDQAMSTLHLLGSNCVLLTSVNGIGSATSLPYTPPGP